MIRLAIAVILSLLTSFLEPSGAPQRLPQEELNLPVKTAEVVIGPPAHGVEDVGIDA
jgi:hypothetical protein